MTEYFLFLLCLLFLGFVAYATGRTIADLYIDHIQRRWKRFVSKRSEKTS